MSTNSPSQVDLAKLFNSVTRELKNNQQALNASDEYNHNHGDNMVENFKVITRAMQQTRGSAPSDQLAHASRVLSQRAQSGSGQMYAQGLAQAAEQMRGQPEITSENAMLLVQGLMSGESAGPQSQAAPATRGRGIDLGSLLGGMAGGAQGQSGQAPAGSDLLSSLLGGMAGGAQGQADSSQDADPFAQPGQAGGGDMLSGLLGAFMGGGAGQPDQTQAGQGGGIDLNTLLTAGMAFFQARQQGTAPVQAIVQAVMAGSQMQGSPHHSQSGGVVAQTLMNTLQSMLSGKK